MDLRLLITEEDAGALMGNEGKTIRQLRKDGAKIRLFGRSGHLERVINIFGSNDETLQTLRKLIEDLKCYKSGNQIDVRMLINGSYLTEVEKFIETDRKIKTYSIAVPESDDYVIRFTYDTHEECINAIKNVVEFMQRENLCITNTRQYTMYATNKCNYGGYACDNVDYTVDHSIQHV